MREKLIFIAPAHSSLTGRPLERLLSYYNRHPERAADDVDRMERLEYAELVSAAEQFCRDQRRGHLKGQAAVDYYRSNGKSAHFQG